MFGISTYLFSLFRSVWNYRSIRTDAQPISKELIAERPRIRHFSFKTQKGKPHRSICHRNSVRRGR